MNSRSRNLSIVIGGAVMGLLGNLPILNLVNCILCIWVWVGGALAVVLYRRYEPKQAPLTGGQGAQLGALAGLIGAVIGLVVYFLTSAISAPIMNSVAQALNIQNAPIFAERTGAGSVIGTLIFFVIDLVLYPGFGALSGMITANIGSKPAAPPTPVG
jgi:hypothetical protein